MTLLNLNIYLQLNLYTVQLRVAENIVYFLDVKFTS